MELELAPMLAVATHRLVEVDTPEETRRAIVGDVGSLTQACAVALWEGPRGDRRRTRTDVARRAVPDEDLERALLERLAPGGAALSTLDHHGDPGLDRRCRAYQASGRHCQVRPLRARGREVGAVAFHLRDGRGLHTGHIGALRRYCPSAAAALDAAHARERLRRLAYTDQLTGIANRRAIVDAMCAMAAAGHRLGLLFVDFDGLKAVNEELSYEHGDLVIAAVGRLLGAVSDDRHVPGRLGGDEFVVVMPSADRGQAAADAARLAEALQALVVPADIRPWFRGASVGWALAADGEGHEALLRRAAAAMRAVKARRKGLRERR
jgi:diguanylate cyclase (GGDEF)-like protein